MDPRNLSWVFFAASSIASLYSCSDAHAAARGTAGTGSTPAPAAPALLANEAGLDPSLSFPVIVGNVVRTITPVPVYLARIRLLAAAIARLDGVTFPEFVRRPAIGVAASAAERRDEARLDARLGFAVVVCVIKPSKHGWNQASHRCRGSRRRLNDTA